MLNWPIYLLMIAIAIVIGSGSAIVTSYFKKRGETFATKADFDEILKQISATTKATEEVRSEISHLDWASREWKTVQRLKLEEFLEAIYQTQQWQQEG